MFLFFISNSQLLFTVQTYSSVTLSQFSLLLANSYLASACSQWDLGCILCSCWTPTRSSLNHSQLSYYHHSSFSLNKKSCSHICNMTRTFICYYSFFLITMAPGPGRTKKKNIFLLIFKVLCKQDHVTEFLWVAEVSGQLLICLMAFIWLTF